MKKIIIILISLTFFIACSEVEELKSIDPDYGFEDEIPDYEKQSDLLFWISTHLYHDGGSSSWQTAIQTWDRTYQVSGNSKIFHLGDCEDGAIFTLYLLRKKFNIQGYLVRVRIKRNDHAHAIAYLADTDTYLEPFDHNQYIIPDVNTEYEVNEMIPYGEAMYMAEQGHYIKADQNDPLLDIF
jgi:hypothetical protein